MDELYAALSRVESLFEQIIEDNDLDPEVYADDLAEAIRQVSEAAEALG